MKERDVLECAAAVVAALAVVVSDKRQWPDEKRRRYSVRSAVWLLVRQHEMFSLGWFQTNLRCSRDVFETICRRIQERWSVVLSLPGRNATIDIVRRVGVTMMYLAQGGSMYSAGQVFGVGKTVAVEAVHQVTAVLCSFVDEVVCPPGSDEEWQDVSAGFENICGFPGVVGAIDGCLISIKRFKDFDGWYCRRGYPAFNMMAVVDHHQRFRAYSLRNGSQNDKSVFNRSAYVRQILPQIPPGTHLVGDAGYQLLPNLMTPFPILPFMEAPNRWYNLVHSRTRIVVEQAFGRLKGKFRIFKRDLLQQTPTEMAAIIKSTLVLHNWFIDGAGELDAVAVEDWMDLDRVWWSQDEEVHGPSAASKRDAIRDALFERRAQLQSVQML